MKHYLFLMAILCGFLIQSCTDSDNSVEPQSNGYTGDKQICIELMPGGAVYKATTSADYDNFSSLSGVIKFNIANYPGVDSVMLVSYLKTTNSTVNCISGLYNSTDSTYLPSSKIQTISTAGEWVQSVNIYKELPKKEITLVPYIKSGTQGVSVSVHRVLLYLYRK